MRAPDELALHRGAGPPAVEGTRVTPGGERVRLDAADERHTPADDDLIGSWALVSSVQVFVDGERRDEFGPDPAGFLCYSPGGIVSATLGDSHRPMLAAQDPQGATPVEYASAASRFIAYAGPFTVDPENGTVTHHVSVSLYPNWEGEDQVRSVTLQGDQLTISASPRTAEDGRTFHTELVWKKIGTGPNASRPGGPRP